MRGKKALHRLCLEVQKLGVQGLHAFVFKDRCNLLLSWAPVKEVFEQGAPHTVYLRGSTCSQTHCRGSTTGGTCTA
jgi:hypothetical protein